MFTNLAIPNGGTTLQQFTSQFPLVVTLLSFGGPAGPTLLRLGSLNCRCCVPHDECMMSLAELRQTLVERMWTD